MQQNWLELQQYSEFDNDECVNLPPFYTLPRNNKKSIVYTAEINRVIVRKLVENIDMFSNEQERWERVAEDVLWETNVNIPWNQLRTHYRYRIVCYLKTYLTDQQTIDRLQYPFLETVYKFRVLFERNDKVQKAPAIVARNKLLLKHALDPRYDEEVVKIFKRYSTPGMPNKVWINVKDPVYELAARWQQFLLKPAGVRSRIMVRTLIGSWIAMLPGYLQKEAEHRPVTAADDNDQSTTEPSMSSSAIMLDDVRVRIEDCTAAIPTAVSPSRLLSMESTVFNAVLQQLELMHSETDANTHESDGNELVADGNTKSPRTVEQQHAPPSNEAPQTCSYVPDNVFESSDSDSENDEEMRMEMNAPASNEVPQTCCYIPDSVFESSDSENESNDEDMRNEMPIEQQRAPPPSTNVPQACCYIPDSVFESSNSEQEGEGRNEKLRVSTSSDTDSFTTVIFNRASTILISDSSDEQPSLEDETTPDTAMLLSEPEGTLPDSTEDIIEPPAMVQSVPSVQPGRLDRHMLSQLDLMLGPHLCRKRHVYDSLRVWVPSLFHKSIPTEDAQVSMYTKLSLLQLIATDIKLILSPTASIASIVPIVCRILYGIFDG